jgi:Reverse transcriptase (RNA-dependent DNA polymerase)
MCFVDLEKAFDRVPREALWTVLRKAGCTQKLLHMIQLLHDGMKCRVQFNGVLSEEFPVTTGVKQGCVLAPTLFALYFCVVVKEALQGMFDAIHIKYRFQGGFFNISRLRTLSRVQLARVVEVLYADDTCLVANSAEALQESVTRLSQACSRFGLKINCLKTEVMRQPIRGTTFGEPQELIYLEETPLREVQSFKYLGSTITADTKIDSEINTRIAQASAAFGRLYHRVFKPHDISISTKIKVYTAVVITTLLYGSETWCVYRHHIKKLDQFHLKCLRKILHIKWSDYIRNTDVLRRADTPGVESLLIRNQLRWCGHVMRMCDNRLPKQILHSELLYGRRKSGGQFLRYKDTIKRHARNIGLACDSMHDLALDRGSWRHEIHTRVVRFEEQRLRDLDVRRDHQKRNARSVPIYIYNEDGELICDLCNRTFINKLGYTSHQRAHERSLERLTQQ